MVCNARIDNIFSEQTKMFIGKAVVIIRCNRLFFRINKMYNSKDMFNFYPYHAIKCMKTNCHVNNVTTGNAAERQLQGISQFLFAHCLSQFIQRVAKMILTAL